MPRFSLIVLSLSCFASVVFGQAGAGPIFGSEKSKVTKIAKKKSDISESAVKMSPDEALIEDLSKWPGQQALATARELIVKGPRIVPLLIKSLENNDWRIRCGCAYALGELKDQSAFPSLQKAIRDISNRISLGPFFQAMAKIDPVAATSEVLPFVAANDVRAAKAAMVALPEIIDQKFAARVIALTSHQVNAVRFRALTLLPRMFRPVSHEVYIRLLADRAPRVAAGAAMILADSRSDEVYKTLQDLVVSGNLRSTCYGILALVNAEDRTNRVLLKEGGPIEKRLLVLLNIRGDFENCVAAIALANMSMRSTDPKLRKFADTAMIGFLLDAAATGKIFKDYISVKDICLQKAAMISGESFGLDARAWVDWWIKNRNGFKARRELRAITTSDAAALKIRFAHRAKSGSFHIEIVAGAPEDDQVRVSRPIYIEVGDMEALIRSMEQAKLMKQRGMRLDPGWVNDYIELTVTLGNRVYRRAHYGDEPADLVGFGDELKELAEREAWQLFRDRNFEPDFVTWFKRTRAKYKNLDPQDRKKTSAQDALKAFATLDPRSRRAALVSFKSAGPAWIEQQKKAFLNLLDSSKLRFTDSRELLATLSMIGGHDVLEAVITYLPLFREDGAVALRSFVERRPLDEILEHNEGRRPDLRVALIPYLTKRMPGHPQVLAKLMSFMSDGDSRVRDALVTSLRRVPNENLLNVMQEKIEDSTAQDQLGLIELFGAIGGQSVVPRLHKMFVAGSQTLKISVIKSLKKAGGAQALNELTDIVKNGESRFFRVAALSALAEMEGGEVRARVRRLLTSNLTVERLRESMGLCAKIFRASLDSDFVPFLSHEDETIRKEAALLLGPLGIKAAAPELMKLLLDDSESNRAWEYLELISCQSVVLPGGEEALSHFRNWFKEHDGEAQHDWFMAAMKAEGLKSQHMLGYLEGKERPFRAIALLIRALESEIWFVRVNAFNYLSRIRGTTLGRLDRRSTPAEIQKTKTRWLEWYNALLEGL